MLNLRLSDPTPWVKIQVSDPTNREKQKHTHAHTFQSASAYYQNLILVDQNILKLPNVLNNVLIFQIIYLNILLLKPLNKCREVKRSFACET